mgnify:CR=1 FL=1
MAESKKKASSRAADELKRNEKKWSPELMRAGWTVFPSVILERQQAFPLDAIDINILLHLARHWWYSENPPFPSKRVIAECMGISTSTVQRRIARMERDGLIERVERYSPGVGRQTNAYLFDGLIEKSKPFAAESVAAREEKKAEAAARRRRKRPRPPRANGTDEGGAQ